MTITNVTSRSQPQVLEGLAVSGDPGAEMAALAVEAGTNERKIDAETRRTYEAAEASQDQQQVDAMRQKANDIESEGWIEAAGMIGQGVLDAAGGAVGLQMLGADSSQLGMASANDVSAIFHGAGLGAQGVATVFATGKRAAEANDDADAQLHKAEADQAKQAVDDMQDAQKDAASYVQSAIDFYRDYVSTEAQTQAAALHKV